MWLIVLAGKHLKTKCRSVISVGQVGFYHVGFKRARLRQVVIRWPDCHGHGRQVCASYNTRDGPHGGPVRCGCGSHRPAKPRQSSPCHRLPKSQIVLWPPAGVPDHGGVALSETVASAQRPALGSEVSETLDAPHADQQGRLSPVGGARFTRCWRQAPGRPSVTVFRALHRKPRRFNPSTCAMSFPEPECWGSDTAK